jgi:hypothetical protein
MLQVDLNRIVVYIPTHKINPFFGIYIGPHMDLFWKIMIASAVLVGLGWIAYGIWDWRERKLEKEQPKARSEKYQQASSSVADYAKKLAEFKKPTYKREDAPPPNNKPPQG